MTSPKILLTRAWTRLIAVFGRGMVISVGSILAVCLVASAAAFLFLNTAAPRTLTITSGPAGSTFYRNAERYQKILAREGVTLKILPSDGSPENLKRLADPKARVDIGFVLGGAAGDRSFDPLMSLGSVSYQPLMVFYRGEKRELLSQFKGKRLNVGPAGSGPHDLALALLKANGIVPGEGTVLDETDFEDPGKELRAGRVDAVFLMGDSTAGSVMRKLLRDGDVRLFSFVQTDAYVRRVKVLNKLLLPRGGLDLGADLPPDAADDRLLVNRIADQTRGQLQAMVDQLRLQRGRAFL